MNLANEGLEARRKEEEASAKKRKAEEDVRWEGVCFRFSAFKVDEVHRHVGRESGTARGQLAVIQHRKEEEKGQAERTWVATRLVQEWGLHLAFNIRYTASRHGRIVPGVMSQQITSGSQADSQSPAFPVP
ncbi:hypothetical protein FRC12_007078 [Ceratobasidium sp. 428]|nr:hypothetical protein FRC12_007078 [Ceratobasidium sp. 428]